MSYFLLIIPALKGENPRPPWDMKVHNPAVLVGRNTHDDGRTSESTDCANRYLSCRYPWRDSGVACAEYSPHHSRPVRHRIVPLTHVHVQATFNNVIPASVSAYMLWR